MERRKEGDGGGLPNDGRAQEPSSHVGQTPWGTRFSSDRRRLEKDRREEHVVAVVRHMRHNGFKFREIVQFLRDAGVVGRRKRPLGMTRIFEIVHGGRKKPKRASTSSD